AVHPVDLAAAMLADPERAFRPGQSCLSAVSGRWYRREHRAAFGIDLADYSTGYLKEVLAVERGSCVCSNVERSRHLAAFEIKGSQPVAGCEPDEGAVETDPRHVIDIRKGTIFAEDMSS